jgi:hypothetical protein
MHAVVMEGLEEFLAGTLKPAVLRGFEAHLGAWEECRETVQGMQEISYSFASLRHEEAVRPTQGFYARVMSRVEQQQARPSFWNLFTLDFAFGRRLIFASLLTLAILGSYLISREAGLSVGPSPETVMAQQDSPGFDNDSSENMLVTLTSYEH